MYHMGASWKPLCLRSRRLSRAIRQERETSAWPAWRRYSRGVAGTALPLRLSITAMVFGQTFKQPMDNGQQGSLFNLVFTHNWEDPESRSEEHTSELQSRENLVC